MEPAEAMVPDSLTSGLVINPIDSLYTTPRDFILSEKSIDFFDTEVMLQHKEVLGNQAVTPSRNSQQVKNMEQSYSSNDSLCSLTKHKSSERLFSSEHLQSSISTSLIKYSTNYNYKSDEEDLQKPTSGAILIYRLI
jgi:hypothetical protein